jgi:hypothetical protein
MRARRWVLAAAALSSTAGGLAIFGTLNSASASRPHTSPPVSRPVSPPVQNGQGQNNNDQGQNGNDQGQNN